MMLQSATIQLTAERDKKQGKPINTKIKCLKHKLNKNKNNFFCKKQKRIRCASETRVSIIQEVLKGNPSITHHMH